MSKTRKIRVMGIKPRDEAALNQIHFNADWIRRIAPINEITSAEYCSKRKAFKCHRENGELYIHVDFVDTQSAMIAKTDEQLSKILLSNQPRIN